MPTILFYCQYLTGMGHLVRSTEIVRSLAQRFRVYFINGGPPIQGFALPEAVVPVILPPLWLKDGQFEIPSGYATVEAVKERRRQLLIETVDRVRPDCLITEFFPFGRHKLLFELQPLLEHVRAAVPQAKVVCSLRDVIGRATLAEEADTICGLVNTYFDQILVHSDPRFLSFAESFPRHRALRAPVHHTGFVTQAAGAATELGELAELGPEPLVLVSVGGGRLGYRLLEASIAASALLAEALPHQLRVFTGPFLPEPEFAQLQRQAAAHGHVQLRRFTPHLQAYMGRAALSVSLTGYNTTMNILKTGVQALVAPLGHYGQDHEQRLRTDRLAELGAVQVLAGEDLEPVRLAQRMRSQLTQPRPAAVDFDLEGATHTCDALQKLLNCPAEVR